MMTQPIRIVQLNANLQNAALHALLNTATADDSADIALITEPWWGDIGNNVKGPVSEVAVGWTPILPVSVVARGQRPRAMAYTRRRHDFTITLRSDIAADLDLQVLEIAQHPHPPTIIVNIYNDDQRQGLRSAAKHLQDLCLPGGLLIIITGDWNLHHPLWSRTADPANESTEQTVDWLTERGYSIINEKGVPTFFSHAHRSWSTIDLTFTNAAATDLNATHHWHVDRNSSFGSDHFALRWSLDYGAAEVENVAGVRYNFKDSDPVAWCNAYCVALASHADDLLPLRYTTRPLTNAELDCAADALTAAMQTANMAAAKVKTPSDHAQPWWNADLQRAAKRVGDLRSQSLAHTQRWGTQACAMNAAIKKSHAYFKCLYKKSRQRWITDTLESATTPDI